MQFTLSTLLAAASVLQVAVCAPQPAAGSPVHMQKRASLSDCTKYCEQHGDSDSMAWATAADAFKNLHGVDCHKDQLNGVYYKHTKPFP